MASLGVEAVAARMEYAEPDGEAGRDEGEYAQRDEPGQRPPTRPPAARGLGPARSTWATALRVGLRRRWSLDGPLGGAGPLPCDPPPAYRGRGLVRAHRRLTGGPLPHRSRRSRR